jgi:hypothetical protein
METEEIINTNMDDPLRHNIGGAMNRPPRNLDPLAPRNMEEGNVMSRQVGGNHYKDKKMQPWSVIDEYNLNYYEGNILKYLLRDKENRIEDLEKLIHYAEKEILNLRKV